VANPVRYVPTLRCVFPRAKGSRGDSSAFRGTSVRDLINDGHSARELAEVFSKYLKAEEDRRAEEIAKDFDQGTLFKIEEE
jgi:hypothetical protein